MDSLRYTIKKMDRGQILGSRSMLHTSKGSHDLGAAVLFVCCLPLLLQTNWTAVNDPTYFSADTVVQTGFPITLLFRTLFAAPNNSSLFGFLDHLDSYSTLAIDFQPFTYRTFADLDTQGNGTTLRVYTYEVIWRANRNSKVGVNAVLNVSRGNLVLHDNDTREVWSTNLPPPKNMIASIEMQSSGSLVLMDGGNRIVWQSFDHPTDTLVMGANLTHTMSLVAASSATDASEGSCKMVMESQGLVLYSTLGTSSSPQPYRKISLGTTFNDTLSLYYGQIRAYSCIRHDDPSRTINLIVVNLGVSRPDLFPSGSNRPNHISMGPTIQFGPTEIASSPMVLLRLDYDGVLRMYAYRYSDYQFWSDNWVKYTESRSKIEDQECTSLPAFGGPYSICSNIPAPCIMSSCRLPVERHHHQGYSHLASRAVRQRMIWFEYGNKGVEGPYCQPDSESSSSPR